MAPAAPAILVSFQAGIGVEWGQRQGLCQSIQSCPREQSEHSHLTEAGRAGLAKLAPSRLPPHTFSLFLASGWSWAALVCGATEGEC